MQVPQLALQQTVPAAQSTDPQVLGAQALKLKAMTTNAAKQSLFMGRYHSPTLAARADKSSPSHRFCCPRRAIRVHEPFPVMTSGATLKTSSYKRILLKLSGEALMGDEKYGISPTTLIGIAQEVCDLRKAGVEVAVVIGGGNIFRGVKGATEGMDRASADYMGMLATCINSLALQDAIEKLGGSTRVLSAIKMEQIAEPYIRRRAVRHLEKGRIVIFAAGTGNPYFTTDTAASLRAMEINAEVILKATKVDGVYTADPKKDPKARRYKTLTYNDVLQNDLNVMDSTAISLCKDNNLPIVVFDMTNRGNITRAVLSPGEIGTVVGLGQTVMA